MGGNSHPPYTPIHASWLNQVEIYFSIIQRKVLTPNDFAKLEAIRVRLALYEELSNRTPKPFAWKFTRQNMLNWLKPLAAFSSSFCCVGKRNRPTATLFVKRTTKARNESAAIPLASLVESSPTFHRARLEPPSIPLVN